MADFADKKENPDTFSEGPIVGGGSTGSSSQDPARNASTASARRRSSIADRLQSNVNAKLENPLDQYSNEELSQMGREYALANAIAEPDDVRAFELGAILAKNPEQYEVLKGKATDEEVEALSREFTHRWSQPKLLYLVIILCSTCAAVQGMDETVVNGAQLFYAPQFGIGGSAPRDTWLLGIVHAAPYICAAFVGCWLTAPLNNMFGRRGTIFITCFFSAVACFWQGFTNSWWHMLVARFALGLGIGPKSSTTPIFAAETTPPAIRGALVMQWQMWTAFGIMVGYAADLALYHVPDTPGVHGLNWRLMMGSAMLPAVVVCCFVFWAPESPRWYMSKNRHASAYASMARLRYNKIQAARDTFYMAKLLEVESEIQTGGRWAILEIFKVPRNRRAMLGSEIVMFMQQFCGVNIIAYYSSSVFLDADLSEISALAASLGFGIINWLFAIPAVYTIDTFGRRNLLLTTFPMMSACLLFTGFSFWIPEGTARIACVALGIYLFGMAYSPGAGPVPFTYSAEAYPLYVRAVGMSLATATTWFFNSVLAVTWPSMLQAFKPQGAFGWYAGWNIVGWMLVLLFMPETKGKTLEELDQVFSVPTHVHAAYGIRQAKYFVKRFLLFQKVQPEQLYDRERYENQTVDAEA